MPPRIRILPPGPLDRPGSEVGDPLPEGLVRPVNAALEGVTPWSRELERAGGDALALRLSQMPEAREGLPAGAVLLTPAGDLPVDFLLHAVLLAPDQGVSREVVARALANVFRRAGEWELGSVALPLLGAGPGQLEVEEAVELLADILADILADARTDALTDAQTDPKGDAFGPALDGPQGAGAGPGAGAGGRTLPAELRILVNTPAEGRLVRRILARGVPGSDPLLSPALEPR